MKGSLSAVVVSLFVFLAPMILVAQENQVVVSNDIYIGVKDATYDHLDVVVDGAAVTIDGSHSFSSLTLRNGALLRHSLGAGEALEVLVPGVVEVDSTSKIDVSALGKLPESQNCNSCGGAHASFGGGRSQQPYGSHKQPLEFGSGGKHAVDGVNGTRGGGRFRLKADKLILDGSILANGESKTGYGDGGYTGGGAGGSIFLEISDIEGEGNISANGGSGNGAYSNGGSGGRVAVYYETGLEFDFYEKISSKGGSGKVNGGPGTVFLHDGAVAWLNLRNANGEFGNLKYWQIEQGSPGVRSSSPSPALAEGAYYLYGGVNNPESIFSQNVSLTRDGFSQSDIDAGRLMLAADWLQSSYHGLDQGELIFRFRNISGDLISEVSSGLTAAEAYQWERKKFSTHVPEGATSVDLVVRSLRKNGNNNDAYFDKIQLKAHLQGFDSINSPNHGGLLLVDNRTPNSNSEPHILPDITEAYVQLRDSALEIPGGANLSQTFIRGNNNASVTFNGSISTGGHDFVVDGFRLTATGVHDFSSLFAVVNRGIVTSPAASENSIPLSISAANIFISSNSSVNVSGKGKLPLSGSHYKSGGSYGGLGGKDPSSGATNAIFGDFKAPIDFGVGGYGPDAASSGTRGGGAIKLVADNRFEVYGDILSYGNYAYGIGGASGGSIWIEAGELIGSASTTIEADGGWGYNAASGGGGRVAIYYDSIAGFETRSKVFARSGWAYSNPTALGSPGTVYIYDRTLPENNGQLQISNHNVSTPYGPYILSGHIDTPLQFNNVKVVIEDGAHLDAVIKGGGDYRYTYVTAEGDFTVANSELLVDGLTLELAQDYSFESITVKNKGKITTPVASEVFASGITLNATDFYISSNSFIDVSFKGNGPGSGEHWKSGGSYGGLGGKDPSSGATNAIFGDFKAPIDFGVGGYGPDAASSGTRGGGAIKLVADNRFEVYGDILSYGNYAYGIGGASGGSIWIEAGELIGSASTTIEADGGWGYNAASGGGGRVAIYYDSIAGFETRSKVFARSGWAYSNPTALGSPGTVYIYDRTLPENNGQLQISNHNVSTPYGPYILSGHIDTPLQFNNVKVVIEDGAHLGAEIKGGGDYRYTYVTAEGDFTVLNSEFVVDGLTWELGQDYAFESITLQNSGKITTPVASDTFTSGITLIANDFYISSDSYIDVTGKGHTSVDGQYWKSGGSYGGLGGRDPLTGGTNTVFGSVENPIDFGVGGYGPDESASGTRGGGAIKLVANKRFELYGDILSNGSQAHLKGGGSGGSIWIEARELVGGSSTLISAEGGDGNSSATGGGGRIAVYFDSLSGFDPASKVLARSGSSWGAVTAYGGPGSVYLYDRSLPSNNGLLQVANYNSSSTYEPYRLVGNIDGPLYLSNVRVQIEEGVHFNAPISGAGYNSAYLVAEGDFTVSNNELVVDGVTLELGQDYAFESIAVQNSGKITTPIASDTYTSGITLNAKDFYISSNSYIDVTGKGHASVDGQYWKSGGSYGGLGGRDPSTGGTNTVFGSIENPTNFGVGGYGVDESASGTRGGGAIKLVASNRFEVYGDILSNGSQGYLKGGGSGGSIWIEARELVGSNSTLISAEGGDGHSSATGGGGRIAVYFDSLSGFDPVSKVLARSGSSWGAVTAYGGPGSVYLYDRSLPSNNGLLQIANYNSSSTYEPYRLVGNIDSPLYLSNARVQIEEGVHFNAPISGAGRNSAYVVSEGDFTVTNNDFVVDGLTWELGQDYTFESITVQNDGRITTPSASDIFTSGITLSAKDFYISSNSYVDVSGKGFLPSENVGYKSGGSYGGLGGVVSGSVTNAIYGSAVAPTDFGMGGRYQDDSQNGHRGGGAIRLVADRLEHYGYIYANGAGHTNYKGAGAGGSIWLEIGELVAGSAGYIHANGGYGRYAGAGGGGRIAIYYESIEGLNLGRVQANAGGYNTSGASAEHGSVHIAEITAPPRVREVSPSGYHSASIDSTIVQFSIGIDHATLDTSDFELVDNTGGAIAVTSVTSLDDIRYQVDFSETLIEGAYTLSVGPDIFGTNGLGMDQDQDGIELEPIDDKYSTQIVIDLTEPETLSLDQPLAPAVIASSNRRVTLSGSREDNTAILVDGNEIVANGSGNWSGTYYLPEGDSTVSVVARDLSGNKSDPVTLIFNVDSKAPSITGANPSGSQNVAPPFITVVVTEEGSGIDLDTSTLV
ncbi:hypothetical protein HXX02_09405, partial [Microbulbifer elongatus]